MKEASKATKPSEISTLWANACTEYTKETGIPLPDEALLHVHSPESLSRQLESEKDNFGDFRMKRRPLLHAMQTVLAPFENWGDMVAGAASSVFPPASCFVVAMLRLVRAARRVSDTFDMILELFQKLGHFALRLESYKGVVLSEGMIDVIGKVLVNSLRVCAAVQNLLSRGSLRSRLAAWAQNVFVEDKEVSLLLGELEDLTSQEHLMVSAQGLKITYQVLRNTEVLLERGDRRREEERLEKLKGEFQPISASGQLFSSINQSRIPGSGAWVEDKVQAWWTGSQPLLWIHGGPGVGKSYLASKIINDLSESRLVGFFFCKNNDVDLRSFNKALRTVVWQVVSQCPVFAVHAEEFCLKEDSANSYALWKRLVMGYAHAEPVCLVFDGVDELDPEEQGVLFSLLQSSFAEHRGGSTLRVILLSRDSIGGLLYEHSLDWIPDLPVGHGQNKDDLRGFVSQRLQKSRLLRHDPEFQEGTIEEISRQAEGLWEWANLVIKSVLRCRTKAHIRKMVQSVPKGINALLEQELQRLGSELSISELSDETPTQIEQLNMMLSLVTLAKRPLSVWQLGRVLDLVFKEEVLNVEEDLRTVYSSLFSIRTEVEEGSQDHIVTLRHSSFYEFFQASKQAGPVHVDVERGNATFLYFTLFAIHARQQLHNLDIPEASRMYGMGWFLFYSNRFLPAYLEKASSHQMGGEISDLMLNIFSNRQSLEPFIDSTRSYYFGQYQSFPSSRISTLGEYWFDAQDRATANQRAELVLRWFTPETKRHFGDHARSSEVASDACPFTILFSFVADACSRRWLAPEEIDNSDGLPEAAPCVLAVYTDMAAVTGGVTGVSWRHWHADAGKIVSVAEQQKKPQTPMWHARVAQSLLLNGEYEAALERFQSSLSLHEQSPCLTPQSLSVIHRDMARACSAMCRHNAALEHYELSKMLQPHVQDTPCPQDDEISSLLYRARMQLSAKLTQEASASVEKAWNALQQVRYDGRTPDIFLFFSMFLELHQLHRLRSVWDFAFARLQPLHAHRDESPPLDFTDVIFDCLIYRSHIMYRVLHYAVTTDDEGCLNLLADIKARFDPLELEYGIGFARYRLSKILFEKGRIALGVQGWCGIVTATATPHSDWTIEHAQLRSLCHLVHLCLHGDDNPIPSTPLALSPAAESSDVCLVISCWLRDHGETIPARDALRGRIKQGLALISDDNPSNDEEGLVRLFKTFLCDPESQSDLAAALYLLKQDQERNMNMDVHYGQQGISQGEIRESNNDGPYLCTEPLTECSNCRSEIQSIHHWHFCRLCPNSTLCRGCYRLFQVHDPAFCEVCNPQHEFYDTGSFLTDSERVPEGKVPVVGSDGERQVIWVEEWKDALAEKWKTAEFTFEGGLSGWVLGVLPEELREKWLLFFRSS